MWITYEKLRNHPHDFVVRYRLYSIEEGGRKVTYQGLRCDFLYAEDDVSKGIYMIHPEFEDENGNVILDENLPVKLTGTARMLIIVPEMRDEVHRQRIRIGVKGFMMEGSRKIGEVEVIRIAALFDNN